MNYLSNIFFIPWKTFFTPACLRCFFGIFSPKILLVLLLCLVSPAPLCATVPTSIPVSYDFGRTDDMLVVAVRLALPQGYHAYAHASTEAGRPTTLLLRLPDGVEGTTVYPRGTLQRDFFDPQASVEVYEDTTTIFAMLPITAAGQMFEGDLSLLLCSSRHCLPMDIPLNGRIPAQPLPLTGQPWAVAWQQLADSELAVTQSRPVPEKEPSVEKMPPLPPPGDFDLQLVPRYADASLEISGLGKALGLGLLAGLLLNAMPCVLPVLTLKISGLLLMGGGREARRRFRQHNICFAAGIMTLFTALALILGMADLIWGQLYQSQGLIIFMLVLVFAMGLSMLGVFSLPIIDLKPSSDTRHPCLQAYTTGLVATFLATPCSGPMLGGVLGWAFTQPLYILMTVFWAVGLGMAIPYLAFSLWPDLARILPHPGDWMHLFERLLGFLLLGTALYLLSILPAEKHVQVLAVLLLTGMGAWLWGRFCGLDAPALRRRIVAVGGILLLLTAFLWLLRPVAPPPRWDEFTPDTFVARLGTQPLLVEFTADWCPNCKFLEATVLNDARLQQWQKEYGFRLIRVDLTQTNAWAVRLLEALGSKSIPLTALFPAGEAAANPLVLRDVYGADTLEQALETAFGP